MKAKEAAEKYNKTPHMTAEEIKDLIPDYSLILHKKQWVSTFLKHINPEFVEDIASDLKSITNPPSKN